MCACGVVSVCVCGVCVCVCVWSVLLFSIVVDRCCVECVRHSEFISNGDWHYTRIICCYCYYDLTSS